MIVEEDKNGVTMRYMPVLTTSESAAPQGDIFWIFPGLKPWAETYSPFGAQNG
jgi:hypothetical protein